MFFYLNRRAPLDRNRGSISKHHYACSASGVGCFTMCPAEAEATQAGDAKVSPGSDEAKPVIPVLSPAPSRQSAPNNEDVVKRTGTAAADDVEAGESAEQGTTCGSSGISFEVAASSLEDGQPTSSGTAAPKPPIAAAQTTASEHGRSLPTDNLGRPASVFVDVL